MKWLLAGLIGLLFVYEAVALWTPQAGDTISEVMWALGRHPLVPFLMGVLMGHFWWPRRS